MPRGPRGDDRARPGVRRGRVRDLLLRAARGRGRAVAPGRRGRRRGRTGPATGACTAARSSPISATGCRRSTTTRCGSSGPSRFFVLDADKFAHAHDATGSRWPSHLLEGLFFGTKNAQQAVGQRERLLALGSLTAGLAHELNNPAAAAVRATAALRERVAGMRGKLGYLAAGGYDRSALEALVGLQNEAAERVSKAKATTLGPLEASDAEDAIADWLDDHGVARRLGPGPGVRPGRHGRVLAGPRRDHPGRRRAGRRPALGPGRLAALAGLHASSPSC